MNSKKCTHYFLYIILASLLVLVIPAIGKSYIPESSEGREFWLAIPNLYLFDGEAASDEYPIYLRISSQYSTMVTVEDLNTGTSLTFSVSYIAACHYELSDKSINKTPEYITKKSIHITSEKPLYLLFPKSFY